MGFYETHSLVEADYGIIEKELDCNLPEAEKQALQRICDIYCIDRDVPLTRWSSTKAQIEAIRKYSVLLQKELTNASDFTAWCLTTAHHKPVVGGVKFSAIERDVRGTINTKSHEKMMRLIEELPVSLERLADASLAALQELPTDKGGRPSLSAVNALVFALESFYEGVTGQQATVCWDSYNSYSKGRFLDFLQTFFEIIGHEADYSSSESLSSIVRRSPRKVKTPPKNT